MAWFAARRARLRRRFHTSCAPINFVSNTRAVSVRCNAGRAATVAVHIATTRAVHGFSVESIDAGGITHSTDGRWADTECGSNGDIGRGPELLQHITSNLDGLRWWRNALPFANLPHTLARHAQVACDICIGVDTHTEDSGRPIARHFSSLADRRGDDPDRGHRQDPGTRTTAPKSRRPLRTRRAGCSLPVS